MSLTARQTADLKVMALEGAKNANIALALGISVEDVHAARSRLGYTIEKAAEMPANPCGCCGAPAPDDGDHLYELPSGEDTYFCERCRLTVDYLNSFADIEEYENNGESEEDEDSEDIDEEINEPEDEDDV